jgi:hypothetical protein
MNLPRLVWGLLNLICAGLLIAAGAASLYYHSNVSTIISGIYVILFSILLVVIEFWVPEAVEEVRLGQKSESCLSSDSFRRVS